MGARVRALAHEQVPAVGNRPELRTQASRVLERIVDRNLAVARAPEDEHGAAHALEVEPRVVLDENLHRAPRVRVPLGPGEEAVDLPRRQRPGVRRAPVSEREMPEPRPPGEEFTVRRDPSPELEPPEEGEPELGPPCRRGDPGSSGEHEAPHVLGTPHREPERDQRTKGVADERGREHPLRGRDAAHALGERVEVRRRGERRRTSVAGKLGDEHPETPCEQGGELDEVRRGPGEPVDEHERRPLSADERAHADGPHVDDPLLEPG